jgi:Tfp pilus assembly protein PilF
MDPGSADNHFGLAIVYQRTSADKLAEKELLEAVEIDSGHLEARLHLGLLYAETGDLEKARDQLRRILEVDPTNTMALESLEILEKE